MLSVSAIPRVLLHAFRPFPMHSASQTRTPMDETIPATRSPISPSSSFIPCSTSPSTVLPWFDALALLACVLILALSFWTMLKSFEKEIVKKPKKEKDKVQPQQVVH
ncbi:hypothetical protein CPB97_010543, partial [Podila verticillata]